MSQFARPDSNITQTAFTGGFAEIDESIASDADQAWSTDGSDATLEVGLSNVTDPGVGTGHILRYRVAKTDDGALSGSGNTKTVIASLYQGATLIGSDIERTLGGAYTTYTFNLSSTQADAITNYSDLRIRFTTLGGGGSPANRRGIGVSWAELEVPDFVPVGVTVTPAQLQLLFTTGTPTVQAGSLVTGLSATLLRFRYDIVSGGIPAFVRTGALVSPAEETLTLGTTTPTVSIRVTVSPTQVGANFGTFTPTIPAGGILVALSDGAHLIASVGAVTVQTGAQVEPASVGLTFSEATPTTLGGSNVSLGAVSTTLGILTPSVEASTIVSHPSTTVLFGTYTPVVSEGTIVPVNGQTLVFQTTAPTIITSAQVAPSSGNISLSTYVPEVKAGASTQVGQLGLVFDIPSVEVTIGAVVIEVPVPALNLSISTSAPVILTGVLVNVESQPLLFSTPTPSVLAGIIKGIDQFITNTQTKKFNSSLPPGFTNRSQSTSFRSSTQDNTFNTKN